MPITISTPEATGRIGPGIVVRANLGGGPIPNDDFVTLNISRLAGTNWQILDSSASTKGLLTVPIIVGWNFRAPSLIQNPSVGLADGAGIRTTINHFHANNTLVQTLTVDTFVWDAVTGLFSYVMGLNGAVVRTYSSP